MAYPQVQSITATTVTSASTTHNITMPATVNANDLLLTLFANIGDYTVTTPAGWTLITTQLSGLPNRLSVYGKIAVGNEDGTTVNFITSSSSKASAQVYRITGDHQDLSTTGIDFGAASGNSTTPNSPNLDPANWNTEEVLWITTFAASGPISSITSYPSSYTGGTYTSTGSSAGTDTQLASARRENTVSAENPGTFTANSSAYWIALTIAIRPLYVSQTITAPLLTNEPTFYGPQLALAGLLIPPLLDNTPTIYAPGLAYEQGLSLDSVLTITPTFYGPTINMSITAPLLTNSPTFYGPTIINTQVLSAPLLTNSPTFYGPEFRGPRNIGAPLLTNSPTFYGPTIFSIWTGADSLTSGTWTDVDIPV